MEKNLILIAFYTMVLPLLGAIIAGLFGKKIGRRATHWVTISLVGISFALASYLFCTVVLMGAPEQEGAIYNWVTAGSYHFDVALLVDRLSAFMVFIVTFVSFMVHIYTIGYMADDPGYQRFFSYVSLFTFAMLALVLANNFFFMFFGWEGVGLVSYLLIGFWFKRESAVFGSLKAFLVNRVGDVGFVIGIAGILMIFDSLNYHAVFAQINTITSSTFSLFPGTTVLAITVICFCLFIGAMAKSAQVPLHVWLPESMEGPTPISALIHAATMVTAGIYMVARCSPLFEFSPATLSFILMIGAITCLFMGILAVFHHDIKRVIAYSTLSQLGYMTVALGASAYNAAIFHLITHAFFKALLFLAAGSVIIALHHEQDMRKMGGLFRKLPITYATFLVGALALSAIPPFAGFYSKDAIIEAVQHSVTPGATFAYICVLVGAFITPLYIFRALFLTFHGQTRLSQEMASHVQESPWVVLFPLIALAIPSVIAGAMLVGPILFNSPTLLAGSIFVLPSHDVLSALATEFHGAFSMTFHSLIALPLWFSIFGIFVAWYFNLKNPQLAEKLKKKYATLYFVIVKKYGFDDFNQLIIVRGCRRLAEFFYLIFDLKFIDGIFVNGLGRLVRTTASITRHLQTGYIYHYALAMVLGLAFFMGWFLLGL